MHDITGIARKMKELFVSTHRTTTVAQETLEKYRHSPKEFMRNQKMSKELLQYVVVWRRIIRVHELEVLPRFIYTRPQWSLTASTFHRNIIYTLDSNIYARYLYSMQKVG